MIAIVQIGNETVLNVENAHCYWFEDNITESELKQEIGALQDMYDTVLLQVPCPSHIRETRMII